MFNNEPILMRIQTFDVYEQDPDVDYSMISGIKISDRPDGYRLTTYPGGNISACDGLAIDVKSPGGIFSNQSPDAATISRDLGELISPATEGLVLPSDSSFKLIDELHRRIQAYKSPLCAAMSIAGVHIEPDSFTLQDTEETICHVKNRAKHSKVAVFGVSDSENDVVFNLDSTVYTKKRKRSSNVVSYDAGTVELSNHGSYKMPADARLAFSALRNSIRNLYQ